MAAKIRGVCVGRLKRQSLAVLIAVAAMMLCARCDRTDPQPTGTQPATQACGATPTLGPGVPGGEGGYSVEGVLMASHLFPRSRGPKRYTVSNPNSRLISAYVQCTTGAVQLDRYVGVGVRVDGSETYDMDLRTFVLEAQRVTVLWGERRKDSTLLPEAADPLGPIPLTRPDSTMDQPPPD